MNAGELENLTASGERETVEFKASLSSGAQREGIQSLVAFANTSGGKVLFGVADDGSVRGVQIGKDTLERLANNVKAHTYPTLPVHIEALKSSAGKIVIVIQAPQDTPPIVGIYMFSSKPIPPEKELAGETLQAYRRVGRTNQKEDFMRLRSPLESDPKIRLTVGRPWLRSDHEVAILDFSGDVWAESDSGSVHRITLHCEPPVCECTKSISDLPYPIKRTETRETSRMNPSIRTIKEMVSQEDFRFVCESPQLPLSVRLYATYFDDWGIKWESSRKATISLGKTREGTDVARLHDDGELRRRIIRFPPKGSSLRLVDQARSGDSLPRCLRCWRRSLARPCRRQAFRRKRRPGGRRAPDHSPPRRWFPAPYEAPGPATYRCSKQP